MTLEELHERMRRGEYVTYADREFVVVSVAKRERTAELVQYRHPNTNQIVVRVIGIPIERLT